MRRKTSEGHPLSIAFGITALMILLLTGVAGAATPTIEFTYVPPYGSSDNLQGKVTNVTPADYKVAVYIYVSGWWTKPTFAQPLTSINNDGSWTCAIVTGGSDQYATKIRAYLVPNGYNPPQMSGGQVLPSELDSYPNVTAIRKPERHITFSGEDWIVKSSVIQVGPGLNYFSDSNQSVWVDDQGQLHLKIVNIGGKWYSSEVYSTKSFGYGTYKFYTASRTDQLDKNVVAGLFTWSDAPEYNHREVDIEFSKWGQEVNNNSQYVVQPWDHSGNRYRFNINLTGNDSVHSFDWENNGINFQSLEGSSVIGSWVYTGNDTPLPGSENVHINLWLYDINGDNSGDPPSDGKEAELIVKKFEFMAPGAPDVTDFKVVPNTSINETNPAVLSANVTKAPDGNLNQVSFGIVDSNNLIGNDGQIIAEYRYFSELEGLYKREWRAHYEMIANATMSDNISVRDESDAPGYFIAIGSFKTNSTSNEIEDNALLWFNDTTRNLSKVTTRFIYGAVPLQIEDGNSTFHALIFKFNESGNMTVKYTSDKIFTLYNLTGNSSNKNPHLIRMNVPDGKYTAYVAAYGNNMNATVKTVGIDTIQPSVSPSPVATFNISGFKINNATGNGIPNWNITVKNSTMQQSMLTGADGSYKFTGLVNGTYNVSEEMKTGFTPIDASYYLVTIAGHDVTNVNFTNEPVVIAPSAFNISGFKINSATGSGIQGWIIMLKNATTDTPIFNTTTDAAGFYQFTNLANGTYNVSEEARVGFTPASATFQVVTIAGHDVMSVNFTNTPVTQVKLGSISGMKFEDINNNGVRDFFGIIAEEEPGLANWQIDLNYTNGTVFRTTMTDNSGNYSFTNVPPGTYTVQEILQPNWTQTAPSTGIYTVTITSAGENVTDIDFGNNQILIPPPPPTARFITDKNTYIQGELVTFTVINNGTQTIDLPDSAPWWVENAKTGEKVFTPIAATAITSLDPGQSKSWTWNQDDNEGKQVPPDTYRGGIKSSVGESYTDEFKILPVPTPTIGSISGFSINSATGKGLSNVTIRLVGIVGAGVDTRQIRMEIMTDSMGKWIFENLPAGKYIIIEQLPKGFIPIEPPVMNIMLEENQNSTNNNFTNRPVETLIPKMPLPPTPPLMEEQESK